MGIVVFHSKGVVENSDIWACGYWGLHGLRNYGNRIWAGIYFQLESFMCCMFAVNEKLKLFSKYRRGGVVWGSGSNLRRTADAGYSCCLRVCVILIICVISRNTGPWKSYAGGRGGGRSFRVGAKIKS